MNVALVKKLSQFKEEQKLSQTYYILGTLRLLRGSISEFTGEGSTGKTSLILILISSLTQNGEICAIVDLNDSFNPNSANAEYLAFENILWIRCGGNIENAFKAIDYLIQAKNFGLIWLNLTEGDFEELNFIPNSYWYRFKNKIKGSPTLLIITVQNSILGSASSQSYHFKKEQTVWSGFGRFKLLKEFQTNLNTTKPFLIKPELITIKARY